MANVSAQSPLGLLVTEKLDRARILDGLGIDYYSDGSKSLHAACRELNLETDRVIAALSQADSANHPETAIGGGTLSELTQHITDTHHRYLRRVLARLEELVLKIKRVHGENHEELHTLADLYQRLKPALEAHITQEEESFFPFCSELEAGQKEVSAEWIAQRIEAHRAEHAEVIQLLREMRQLTAGYFIPEDACNTYRMTFNALADLEADTHLHIHKENNMLFARIAEHTAGR
jgi:regulator of cell morphogenesis and NO signaling